MAKLTNGRAIVEVPDERAVELAWKMGYKIMVDPVPDDEDEVEEIKIPRPRRGRPPKKAS